MWLGGISHPALNRTRPTGLAGQADPRGMAANPSKLPMPPPAHAGLLLKLPWWEVKPAQAGSGTHHWFFNPSEKPASAKPRWWVRDQSCAIATKLQKEWLVFLSYKCVKKGRKKI